MADRHSKLSSRGSVPCRACHRIERAPPPVEEQDRSKPALAISTPNSLGQALDSLCCRHPFEIRFEGGESQRSGRIRRVGSLVVVVSRPEVPRGPGRNPEASRRRPRWAKLSTDYVVKYR